MDLNIIKKKIICDPHLRAYENNPLTPIETLLYTLTHKLPRIQNTHKHNDSKII